jgi:hypothetical protein
MIRDGMQRLSGLRRSVLVGAAALMVAVVCAAPALAKSPTGEFAVFKQCPVGNPSVALCFYAVSSGGEFHVGTTTVPINKPITLQGGSIVNEETGAETFVAAANGESLSKTALNVPGGLLGIMAPSGWPTWLQNIFNEFINNGITGVTATTELVGNPGISRSNLLSAEGTALELPVRVKLGNTFLGESCFIGSAAHPIIQHLTTGTTSPPAPNTPISGTVGELSFNEAFTKVTIKNNSLVDNAYAAPSAEGCGGIFSFLIDPAINAKLGLPAAAGHNTTRLNGTLENATAAAVKESEH